MSIEREFGSRREALRIHKIHCRGCSEYRHGGVWNRPLPAGWPQDRDAGFDSPPPSTKQEDSDDE